MARNCPNYEFLKRVQILFFFLNLKIKRPFNNIKHQSPTVSFISFALSCVCACNYPSAVMWKALFWIISVFLEFCTCTYQAHAGQVSHVKNLECPCKRQLTNHADEKRGRWHSGHEWIDEYVWTPALVPHFIRIHLKIAKKCCLYLDIFSCVKMNAFRSFFTFRLEIHVRCDNQYKTGADRENILGQLMLFDCVGICIRLFDCMGIRV